VARKRGGRDVGGGKFVGEDCAGVNDGTGCLFLGRTPAQQLRLPFSLVDKVIAGKALRLLAELLHQERLEPEARIAKRSARAGSCRKCSMISPPRMSAYGCAASVICRPPVSAASGLASATPPPRFARC
jgi:hypothetical protein